MISILKGTIESIEKDSLILMTAGGVGYSIQCRFKNANFKMGDSLTVHTYLKVSDNAMELYGFEKPEEKVFFELLLTVSGVGPKAAMRVLSLGSIEEIQSAIARGDAQYLTAVQGMGKKTAERLCVELKSKIATLDSGPQGSAGGQVLSEVIDGLVAMGYGKEEARHAISGLDAEGKSTEELLRIALQQIQ